MSVGTSLTLEPSRVDVIPGQPVTLNLQLANENPTVETYDVQLIGLDPAWVQQEPLAGGNVPATHRSVAARVNLPRSYPAGNHDIGVQVTVRPSGDQPPRDLPIQIVTLVVPEEIDATFAVTPTTVNGRRQAKYTVIAENHGNAPLHLILGHSDPERAINARFKPTILKIEANSTATSEMKATGPRAWFGSPAARLITVTGDARPSAMEAMGRSRDASLTALVTFMQKPRFPLWLISLLSLLLLMLLWIAALLFGINKFVPKEETVAEFPLSGVAIDGPSGAPLRGVVVSAFNLENPESPQSFALTGPATSKPALPDGSFTLMLPEGLYKVSFTVSGEAPVWYSDSGGVPSSELADAIAVREWSDESDDDAESQDSQPFLSMHLHDVATICGTVNFAPTKSSAPAPSVVSTSSCTDFLTVADDVRPRPSFDGLTSISPDGGVVQLVTSSNLLSDAPTPCPTPTVPLQPGGIAYAVVTIHRVIDGVAITDDSAGPLLGPIETNRDGEFLIDDLPSPATYQLSFTTIGASEQSLMVTVGNGLDQQVEQTLFPGTHELSGRVLPKDRSEPILCPTVVRVERPQLVPGVSGPRSTIVRVDPETQRYRVGGLESGDYLVTALRHGFEDQNQVVTFTEGVAADPVDLTLLGAPGVIKGSIWNADMTALGGVKVMLTDQSNEIVSLTDDANALFGFTGLATPATYTIAFIKDGFVPQVLTVDLRVGEVFDHEITMTPVAASDLSALFGTVVNRRQSPVAGATIKGTNGSTSFEVMSSNDPVGAFKVTDLPPGAYSITVTLDDEETTVLRELGFGEQVELSALLDVEAPLTLEQLTLSENGIGPLTFGSDAEEVLKELTATLGPPSNDTGPTWSNGAYGTCRNTTARIVHFGLLVIVITVEEAATPDPAATPTATPEPTATTEPTATPEPNVTPEASPTPEPTPAPEEPPPPKQTFAAYLLDERFDPDAPADHPSRLITTDTGLKLGDRDPRIGDEPAELITGIYSTPACMPPDW